MGTWPSAPKSRKVTVASSFKHLRDFIQKQMRMSHIYQPVTIRELLKRGGEASVRNIAGAFLARDESQLEYYEQITKDMPGKVLGKHGIVQRDGNEYRLAIDPSSLSSEERDELVRLCDEAISAYLQKRGAAVYDHRRGRFGLPLGKPAL
jgi:ATP adenylyltransferase